MSKVKEMTRAQAERAVARTTDEKTLKQLAQHQNKHVVAKAEYKLARLPGVVS